MDYYFIRHYGLLLYIINMDYYYILLLWIIILYVIMVYYCILFFMFLLKFDMVMSDILNSTRDIQSSINLVIVNGSNSKSSSMDFKSRCTIIKPGKVSIATGEDTKETGRLR